MLFRSALLEYANKHQMQLDQVKADLAKTAMQEQTKRQLASVDAQLQANTESDQRIHDMNKHVMNVESNKETAALARAQSDQQQAAQHEHEIEVEKMKLKAAKQKSQDVPGKRY